MPSIISFPITTKVATKADVGLPLADNTADPDKPISIAQAAVNTAQGVTNAAKADAAATTASLATKAPNLLTGVSFADAADLVATDVALTAWGKLQAKFTGIAATILSTVLTGLSTATATVVAATDSVLVAIGKLQAQVSLKVGSVTAGTNVTIGGTATAPIINASSGATSWSALTDKTTAPITTDNTPLANALAGKGDALAPIALTGATTLTRALHGNRQITFTGANATLTVGTDAASLWTTDDSVEVHTLAGSAGVPTISFPDGKTITGSITTIVGGTRKGVDSWTVGTTGAAGALANTDALPEGTTNFYSTLSRVQGTLLTGLGTVAASAVAATDTFFGAVQKIIANIATKQTIGTRQTVVFQDAVIDTVTVADGVTYLINTGGQKYNNTTITLPLNPVDLQFFEFFTVSIIQRVTWAGNGKTLNGLSDITAFTSNTGCLLRYTTADGWSAVSFDKMTHYRTSDASRLCRAYGSTGWSFSMGTNASLDFYIQSGGISVQATADNISGRPATAYVGVQNTLAPVDNTNGQLYAQDSSSGFGASLLNVNGRWGSGSVTSITTASTVATATIADTAKMKIGQIVLIAGASVGAFNGNKAITSVPTGTTFTYAIADQAGASAVGTLTWAATNDAPASVNLINVPSTTRSSGTSSTWLNFGTNQAATVLSFAGGPLRIGVSGAASGFEVARFDDVTGNAYTYKGQIDASKVRQTLANAGTVTMANNTRTLLIKVTAAGIASGTVNLPAAIVDGQKVTVSFSDAVTTLTFSGNGKSIIKAPTTAVLGDKFSFMYDATDTAYYPI